MPERSSASATSLDPKQFQVKSLGALTRNATVAPPTSSSSHAALTQIFKSYVSESQNSLTGSKQTSQHAADSPNFLNAQDPSTLHQDILKQLLKEAGIEHRPKAHHKTLVKLYKTHLAELPETSTVQATQSPKASSSSPTKLPRTLDFNATLPAPEGLLNAATTSRTHVASHPQHFQWPATKAGTDKPSVPSKAPQTPQTRQAAQTPVDQPPVNPPSKRTLEPRSSQPDLSCLSLDRLKQLLKQAGITQRPNARQATLAKIYAKLAKAQMKSLPPRKRSRIAPRSSSDCPMLSKYSVKLEENPQNSPSDALQVPSAPPPPSAGGLVTSGCAPVQTSSVLAASSVGHPTVSRVPSLTFSLIIPVPVASSSQAQVPTLAHLTNSGPPQAHRSKRNLTGPIGLVKKAVKRQAPQSFSTIPSRLSPSEIKEILMQHNIEFDVNDDPSTLARLYRSLTEGSRSEYPSKKHQVNRLTPSDPPRLGLHKGRWKTKVRQDSPDFNFVAKVAPVSTFSPGNSVPGALEPIDMCSHPADDSVMHPTNPSNLPRCDVPPMDQITTHQLSDRSLAPQIIANEPSGNSERDSAF